MIAEFKIYDMMWDWEQTPVTVKIQVANEFVANDIALGMAAAYGTEIRWNFENVTQGHYVGTLYRFGMRCD